VLAELAADEATWDGYRLLDRKEEREDTTRAGSRLALRHIFTMLSLVSNPEPLAVAFHGVLSDDRHLRGTALEYLDSILPEDVRRALRPHVEGRRARRWRRPDAR